jgi:anti-sigma B factor antagonist
MDAAPLTARTETAPDGLRIELHGRIDRDGDAALSKAYTEATAAGDGILILDFAGVDYINSTGIALIVRLLADARRERREVRARGLTEHYREIFRITRLADFMVLEQDLAAQAEGGAA